MCPLNVLQCNKKITIVFQKVSFKFEFHIMHIKIITSTPNIVQTKYSCGNIRGTTN